MTPRQLETLQHALGLDQYGQGEMYRNHFCASAADEPDCRALVEMGYMRRHPTTDVFPYFNCSVQDAGKDVVRTESPAPPKLTRGQRRYRQYLREDCGYSFGEWLKENA